MLNAHKRSVKVEVILDKSQRSEKYSSADFFAHAGIPTYIDSAHAIAHNKIMCLDQITLITGSFNLTKAAEEKKAENLFIHQGQQTAGLGLSITVEIVKKDGGKIHVKSTPGEGTTFTVHIPIVDET